MNDAISVMAHAMRLTQTMNEQRENLTTLTERLNAMISRCEDPVEKHMMEERIKRTLAGFALAMETAELSVCKLIEKEAGEAGMIGMMCLETNDPQPYYWPNFRYPANF